MRVSVFTKVEGMVVVESATSVVKPEVAEDGILETERLKSSGLSAVQLREKDALGSMLYLLFSPSITLSEEWREAVGGAVRSVVNSREPAGEGEGSDFKVMLATALCLSTHFRMWDLKEVCIHTKNMLVHCETPQ